MKTEIKNKESKTTQKFVEDVDYYFENGLMVLTAHFLKNRGYCCNNSCRHCPYLKEDRK
jgi:hypothetical protein